MFSIFSKIPAGLKAYDSGNANANNGWFSFVMRCRSIRDTGKKLSLGFLWAQVRSVKDNILQ